MNAWFREYAGATGRAYDEMFDGGALRPPYEQLRSSVGDMSEPELRLRVEALQAGYLEQGVTFDIGGEERAFPLDILPRVIEMEVWAVIDAGVQQRVRALERFLADVYDAGEVFADGVVPREVVVSSSHFHRQSAGVVPANGVRIHVAGIDLIRDPSGEFRVLEDNVRVPSGVSYVMTNRRAIASVMPETIAAHRIRPVAGYPQRLLAALRAAAPAGVTEPVVVVLTPGVFNGAYFEHALLARSMGVELVEGRDLVCSRGRVLMRTTRGLTPIHVVYRRVDDEFLDPVHFRADSLLGCPGLVDAARAGNVTIANAIGNGIADDKLIYTYVPDLIRYYLSEQPVLKNVDTTYRDYFGAQVTSFEVAEAHDALTIVSTSTVRVDRRESPPANRSWEELRDPATRDRLVEYLQLTPTVSPPDDLHAHARALAHDAATPSDAATAICRRVHREVDYESGSTHVATVAADAWGQRSGVCQDLAHLAIGALRSVGIAARYVSGYFHPRQVPVVGETVDGESHAWIEWWDDGWQGFDPTNDHRPGDRHVVVATGREYVDVRPLSGIYSGANTSRMFVSVQVTRLA